MAIKATKVQLQENHSKEQDNEPLFIDQENGNIVGTHCSSSNSHNTKNNNNNNNNDGSYDEADQKEIHNNNNHNSICCNVTSSTSSSTTTTTNIDTTSSKKENNETNNMKSIKNPNEYYGYEPAEPKISILAASHQQQLVELMQQTDLEGGGRVGDFYEFDYEYSNNNNNNNDDDDHFIDRIMAWASMVNQEHFEQSSLSNSTTTDNHRSSTKIGEDVSSSSTSKRTIERLRRAPQRSASYDPSISNIATSNANLLFSCPGGVTNKPPRRIPTTTTTTTTTTEKNINSSIAIIDNDQNYTIYNDTSSSSYYYDDMDDSQCQRQHPSFLRRKSLQAMVEKAISVVSSTKNDYSYNGSGYDDELTPFGTRRDSLFG